MALHALSGRCLCGAVSLQGETDRKDVTVCHCGQCRKWSGRLRASVNAPHERHEVSDAQYALGWHRASPHVRRGFCKICGSALFWHGDGLDDQKERIAIAAGAMDAPTALALEEHIYVADKGDYYEIADGLKQAETH